MRTIYLLLESAVIVGVGQSVQLSPLVGVHISFAVVSPVILTRTLLPAHTAVSAFAIANVGVGCIVIVVVITVSHVFSPTTCTEYWIFSLTPVARGLRMFVADKFVGGLHSILHVDGGGGTKSY